MVSFFTGSTTQSFPGNLIKPNLHIGLVAEKHQIFRGFSSAVAQICIYISIYYIYTRQISTVTDFLIYVCLLLRRETKPTTQFEFKSHTCSVLPHKEKIIIAGKGNYLVNEARCNCSIHACSPLCTYAQHTSAARRPCTVCIEIE